MATYKRVQDFDLRGNRVLVRVDFNTPLEEKDGKLVVADDARIRGALETIQHVRARDGKCILASHLGRPKGAPNPKYSLEPVGQRLSELLDTDVILTESCVGDGPRGLVHQMRPGEVILLENLRFHAGEEGNDAGFAHQLAELCDVFVNDAFGALHRAHASTAAIAEIVPKRGIGFLVQKELKFLEPLRDKPRRPFVLVMGGAKVSDKIGVIDHFLDKADAILVGGAMAYSFLKSRGIEIGKSLCSDEQVTLAARALKAAEARNVSLLLPVDHVVAKSFDDTEGVVTEGAHVPRDRMGVDIGPKTIAAYEAALATAETIFWNGPMGVFEKPAFAKGTFELARIIGGTKAQKLAGGGDVSAALAASGCEGRFDFVSTGGGATLEYLEGRALPGLKALEVSHRAG